jgi:cytochrome c oxidase assembly factor 6
MVWPFSSSTSPSPGTPTSSGPKSSDGGYIAPDRSRREKCYMSRDRLYACLDRNDILDAVKEDEKSRKVCKAENEEYEANCAKAWVS